MDPEQLTNGEESPIVATEDLEFSSDTAMDDPKQGTGVAAVACKGHPEPVRGSVSTKIHCVDHAPSGTCESSGGSINLVGKQVHVAGHITVANAIFML